MINVSTTGTPSIKVDGLDLAQLRAICRRVAANPIVTGGLSPLASAPFIHEAPVSDDPLADIARGYVNLINGVLEIARVEVPSND